MGGPGGGMGGGRGGQRPPGTGGDDRRAEMRALFEKAGFGIVELSALSGFWCTFGQLFAYNLERVNRGVLRRLRIVDLAELLVQGAAVILDRIDRTEQWTWMYLVVARKP